MTTNSEVTINDLLKMFDCKPDEANQNFFSAFNSMNTTYQDATQREYDEYILEVLKRTTAPNLTRSRDENLVAFETGWKENLELISSKGISVETLKPKYFRKNKFLRYKKKLIVSDNLDIEHDLFILARHLIFTKYLGSYLLEGMYGYYGTFRL